MREKKYFFFLILLFMLIWLEGCMAEIKSPPQGSQPVSPTVSPAKQSTPAPSNNQASPSAGKTSAPQNSENADFMALAPTTAMTFSELVGDNGDYSEVEEYPKSGTYKLVVNVYYQFITAYKKDDKGAFTVPVRYMICSTGARKTPTPTGKFKMGSSRKRFSKFVTYGVFGQYWSQITRSIFFHSLLYTKKDANTYTKSSYRNLGKQASHGCIRMLVPDARWIYYNIAPGTEVEIITGKKDPVQEGIKNKLTRAKLPSSRPTLIKGKIPVTEPWPGYTGPVSAPAVTP